ncbi:BTAD domain-containing putative transcriptional regulator [Streptomyces sp. M19]
MLALYRCGRQSDALNAYQRARRVLGEELGVEPGAELQEVQGRILAAEPSMAWPGRNGNRPRRPPPIPPHPPIPPLRVFTNCRWTYRSSSAARRRYAPCGGWRGRRHDGRLR